MPTPRRTPSKCLFCFSTLVCRCARLAYVLLCARWSKNYQRGNVRCSFAYILHVCAFTSASKSVCITNTLGSTLLPHSHDTAAAQHDTAATQHDGRPPPTNPAAPGKTAPRPAAATRGHSCARRSTTATRRGDASADTQGRRGQGESAPTHALSIITDGRDDVSGMRAAVPVSEPVAIARTAVASFGKRLARPLRPGAHVRRPETK